MAPVNRRKRSHSHVSVEDSELDSNVGSPVAQPKKSRGTDWSAVQAGTRNQEADRVKQYVTMFEKDIVVGGRDKAMDALTRGEEAKAKQDKKNLERIRDAYDTASAGASLGVADHPLYTAGLEVLELFHATLTRYEEANRALESISDNGGGPENKTVEAVQASWKQDRAEAYKLLGYGRVYGDSLVHDIIVPKGMATPTSVKGKEVVSGLATPEGGLNKTGRSALEMFPRSRATVARGQTWGEAAKSQVLALKGLLKTLPGVGGSNVPSVQKTVTFDI